jgi:lipopolysaccharide export system permease protein
MMLFDSTVRRELSRSFAATLVVILTIVLTMFLIRTLGQAAGGRVAPQDVVLLLGYIAMGHLPTMLALSLFVAIVVTLGRMYRESEMVIWFASGVSLRRFVGPVLRASWPVLVLIGALVLFVWPWGNRNMLELRDRYAQRSDLMRVSPGVFQSSSDGSRVFFVERAGDDGIAGKNVFILTRKDGREAVTSARSGKVVSEGDSRFLVLEDGFRQETDANSGNHSRASFESFRALADDRSMRRAESLPPRATGSLDLLRDPTPANQGELTWRLGLLFGAANLLLLGIGLSFAQPRRASNWNLLFALLGFVIYYNLINLSQAWVVGGRIGFGTALALLHIAGFALASALIWWRDHAATASFGASMGRRQRRARA